MNKRTRIRTLCAIVATTMCLSAASGASADAYPDKRTRIIVPYTPGGFNDTLGRTMADRLAKAWNQPVLVENRPGGNTLIGNGVAAKSPPDGYTMLVTPLPYAALPALYGDKLPYDPVKDFTPVIWAATTPNVLVVREGLGITSVAQLIDYAKKNPGKLTYGSTGSGSSNHLSMELFMSMTGTKMVHIPYKGSAPAVMAMLSGETDVLFDNLPNLYPQLSAGKLKPIAVTGLKRAPLLPDVPTVQEAGVPGYEVIVWFGFQMPAGTPKAIVDRANRDLNTALKDPTVVKLFREQGVESVGSSPEAFADLLAREITKWTKVVRDAGVKVE